MEKKLQTAQRSRRGTSVILLVTAIGLIVLPLIAMFAFEVSRANLGTQQLKNAADAASLAAVATLASGDNNDLPAAQLNAKQTALEIFQKNSILGQSLSNSSLGTSVAGSPPALQGEIFVQFLDPNTMKVVPDGDPNGKIVRLTASYGLVPAFGQYLGLGRQVIVTGSNGAVPQLDVVVCFDISGSIDDQTQVTMVRRELDPSGKIVYTAPTSNTKSHGKIFDIVIPNPAANPGECVGSALNGVPLQNLAEANQYGHSGLQFSEYYARTHGNVIGMRAGYTAGSSASEQGRAPGSFYGAPTFAGVPQLFTDEVVNLDDNETFGGFTDPNGFAFPDLATLVEASRGNLENPTVAASSKANSSTTVTPRSGYQQAYFTNAIQHIQPIQDAKDATTLFAQIINNDTDSHFGLVTFDDSVGLDPNSTQNHREIDDNTPYGSSVAYPNPLIPLNNGVANTQYQAVVDALTKGVNGRKLVAKGGTNIGLAIQTAVNQIKSNGRINAVKAIVLFTDGQPTVGGPLNGDPFMNARAAAVLARNSGIPIYTIGLGTNPQIRIKETEILNADNSDPNTGGVAGISGQGATFHLVSDSKQLRSAFETIARHLCQLVQDTVN